jgi:hypothetical protein
MTNWLIKKYLEGKRAKKNEKRVIERYKILAGLIRDGQMVNKDKEARARQWVKEQEEKKTSERKQKKWWDNAAIQLVMLLGAIASIIALIIFL